jgi:predicted nucleic acid-binding protein
MDYVLIDTDVILDFFFDREPFVKSATEVFLLCEKGEVKGFVTPVIICNVYYLLRKVAKHHIIVEKLKQLLTIIDVVQMNKTIIIDALNSEFKDFEDALQNFSAVSHQQISFIITRNVKDYQKSKLSIFSPDMYLSYFKNR